MSRKKDAYIVNVHFPNSEDELIELRKRMGIAYVNFVEEYIKKLPIEDEKKNKIYIDVIQKLKENYSI